jgi:NAD(P)H-hydrate epimerase
MKNRTLSRQQVRDFDRLAIHKYGIPGVVLMENAGRAVAQECVSLWPPGQPSSGQPKRPQTIAILCGGGNNGGDGYVIARHLHIAGARVQIYRCVERRKITGDADTHRRITENMGLSALEVLNPDDVARHAPNWGRADYLIDALLGTGFKGNLRSPLPEIIRAVNGLAAFTSAPAVIAVDLPSGLDCDTGEPSQPTIRAAVTVTFVALKPGFVSPLAQPFFGRVVVAGIGAPLSICDELPAELALPPPDQPPHPPAG